MCRRNLQNHARPSGTKMLLWNCAAAPQRAAAKARVAAAQISIVAAACRLRWRQRQPITVLELRCRRLQVPLTLPNSPDLWGCFSWVSLPAAQDAQSGGSSSGGGNSSSGNGTRAMGVLLEGAVPVMADEDFAKQARALRAALDGVQGVQEVPMYHP
jgi:uncharacterized membrane protein YgcG